MTATGLPEIRPEMRESDERRWRLFFLGWLAGAAMGGLTGLFAGLAVGALAVVTWLLGGK